MAKRGRELTAALRNAAVWLERQPGVTSVVKGRWIRSTHRFKAGFAKVLDADARLVRLRVFDATGSMEMTVHSPASANRDKWVAKLAAGDVVDALPAPRLVASPNVKTLPSPEVEVYRPAAVKENAAQIYDVTPELAAKWLERNQRNRKLRQSVVNRYAADMRAGKWMLTGDTVQFDTNGNVINGQHRLWAVFESGVTVPMMVAFNLPPAAVAVLDDHLKRNLADVASISRPGTTISNIHTAVANMLLQSSILATAVDRRKALERITRQAQLDALDRHWDAIEFAYREAFRSAKQRGLTVAPVLTPVARAFYTQDLARLRQFGKVMMTGMPETDADQAAVMLRNLLLKSAAGSVRPTSDVVYRKTERALHGFLNGERLSTLYEAPSELFPLPEDQPAGKVRR